MSQPDDDQPLELHLFSPDQDPGHVELLTAIAHYHRTGNKLGLGHTVNFGRPWMPDSDCTYGLISLPYLDGPNLENAQLDGVRGVAKFLWLIPITGKEREYKIEHGLTALEERFEHTQFNYLDPIRASVV